MSIDWQRFKPRYWMQLYPTCRNWDALLNEALDHGITSLGPHTADIGGVKVWVANWPYAYGSPYRGFGSGDRLPTVRTRQRLRAAVHAYELDLQRKVWRG